MADYCEHGDEHSGCVEGCESFDPLSLTDSAEWSESEPYEGHLAALYSTSCSVPWNAHCQASACLILGNSRYGASVGLPAIQDCRCSGRAK